MCSSSARQVHQTAFPSWQDTIPNLLYFFISPSQPCVYLQHLPPARAGSAEQQVFCRIKAGLPFQFLWLCREQLLIFTCVFVLSVPAGGSFSAASDPAQPPWSTQGAAAGHHTPSCSSGACPAPVPAFPEAALPGQQQQQQPAGASFLLSIP